MSAASSCTMARAAEIRVFTMQENGKPGHKPGITITGRLEQGDIKKFTAIRPCMT